VSDIGLFAISSAILTSTRYMFQVATSTTTAALNAFANIFSDQQFVNGVLISILLGLVTGSVFAKAFGFDILRAIRSFTNSLFAGTRDLAERLAE